MTDIEVKYESYYSYDGRLDTPNVTHSTWSLLSFAASYCVPEIGNAIKHFGVIPPRHLMNEAFERGKSIDRALAPGGTTTGYSWTPFRISEDEYLVLSAELIRDSEYHQRIADDSLWSHGDIDDWYKALIQKIKANPTYTELSWQNQHALLGIPIHETRWIPRDRDFKGRKSTEIDRILNPLKDFFRGMEQCTPDCCQIEAYNFFEETILLSADKVGRASVMKHLINAEIDLGELDPSIEVVRSEILNSCLMRGELVALIEHFSTVLSGRQGDLGGL